MTKRPSPTQSKKFPGVAKGSDWGEAHNQVATPGPHKGVAKEPNGRWTKLPPEGPSNIIVRSSNLLPAPKDVSSQ